MKRTRSVIVASVAIVGLGAAATAYALTDDSPAPAQDKRSVVMAQGHQMLPNDTPTDWVSYTDHVAVMSIVPGTEQELPQTEDEQASGEGMVVAEADLKISKVLWSRDGAPSPPETVRMPVSGWSVKGGERTRIVFEGQPSLEEGHTYIMALVSDPEHATWQTLGILPYDSRTIGRGEFEGKAVVPGDRSELTRVESAVEGDPAADLVALLNSTEPDPAAVEHWSLPGVERWIQVSQEASEAEPTDPAD